ncbi:hypothetical protein ABFS83_11G010800 [Erythranthe nasuta]
MQNQANHPPPGYPSENPPPSGKKRMKCLPRTKAKGDRGFIEGCLFALCCCWLCEVCFD